MRKLFVGIAVLAIGLCAFGQPIRNWSITYLKEYNRSTRTLDLGSVGQTITVADEGNKRAMTLTQNDTTNNPEAVRIVSTSAENALFIDMNADAGNSTSTGGAILVDNTGNVGAGIVVYSDIGATADGRLLSLRADNTAFDQQLLRIDNDGVQSAISVDQATTAGSAEAVSIASLDTTNTALGVSGSPTAKGVAKLTHNATASGNSNGSVLSLAAESTANDAQGLFVNHHASGTAINVDSDTSSASATTSVNINSVNAGAGRAVALNVAAGMVELAADVEVMDAVKAGTKVISGIPVNIIFSPDAAATLTYTVPTGYDLVVHAAWGYKAGGNGAHADDDLDLQHNDGSAANIFATEELNGVNDGVYFEFSGLVDTENEIEAGETLDLVASENGANGCDAHVIVVGTYKVAD